MRGAGARSFPRAAVGLAAVIVAGPALLCGCSTAGADVAGALDSTRDLSWPVPRPCDFADADSLRYLTDVDALRIAQPFVFERVDCSGTTATAYTLPDGVNPSVAVRFEYMVGCWRSVAAISLPRGRTDENSRSTMEP